ncbi:MAG: hypothetical protein ACR2LJ_14060 [Acidimicrobiales bacterium]
MGALPADLSWDACPDEDDVMGVATTRGRSVRLGIGTDTAARALHRLDAAGVLPRRPRASEDVGRFRCCTYEFP